jgi:hypothetical protein
MSEATTVGVGLAASWGLGLLYKHKASWFDHKTFGPFVNIAVGQIAAATNAQVTPTEGLGVAAAAVLTHEVGKGLSRLMSRIHRR